MPDTDKPAKPRLYGQADEDGGTPAGPGDARGEQGNTFADPNPEQTRDEQVDGGTIAVTEVSGTAFAEKSGRSGLAREGSGDDEG